MMLENLILFQFFAILKDAVLSIPGAGQYVQQKVTVDSRIGDGILNLSQMKSILEYMLNIVGSIEQETKGEMYVLKSQMFHGTL